MKKGIENQVLWFEFGLNVENLLFLEKIKSNNKFGLKFEVYVYVVVFYDYYFLNNLF